MKELNCVISYFFQLHLMLHACVRTFDVTGTVENFLGTVTGPYCNQSFARTVVVNVLVGHAVPAILYCSCPSRGAGSIYLTTLCKNTGRTLLQTVTIVRRETRKDSPSCWITRLLLKERAFRAHR